MYTRLAVLALFVFALVAVTPSTSQAQDAYVDSVFSKIEHNSSFLKSITNKTLKSIDEVDFDSTDDEEDNNEYGIGNVLGKKKKTVKANKKTGKAIKVQIDFLGNKVVSYELRVDKGVFKINKTELEDN